MTPDLRSSVSLPPFYRRRWFKRLTIAIIGLLVVAAAVALTLLMVWWNSPERALLSAVEHSVKIPGSYRVKSRATDLSITIRDQEYAATGTFNGIPVEAVQYGSILNLKSSRPEQLYNLITGNDKDKPLPTILQAIIPTIANKWIAFDLDNVALKTQGALAMQCVFQEKESVAHDPSARQQWASTYFAH